MKSKKTILTVILYTLLIAGPQIVLAQNASTPTTTNRIAHVPILIYHSVRPYYPGITNLVKEFTVPPDVFDDQMKYLRDNGFTPVTFDNITRYFKEGAPLPPRPVVVTLDDGWENQYLYAYPILKKYRFPGIFYVYPGALDKKHFLTYAEIKDMIANNMIVAGHSQTHPILSKIADPAILTEEILGSKKVLESKLGISIQDFAYPFGAYNDQDINVVLKSGYRSARTVHAGVKADANAPFTIDGIIVTGDFNRFVNWVNK